MSALVRSSSRYLRTPNLPTRSEPGWTGCAALPTVDARSDTALVSSVWTGFSIWTIPTSPYVSKLREPVSRQPLQPQSLPPSTHARLSQSQVSQSSVKLSKSKVSILSRTLSLAWVGIDKVVIDEDGSSERVASSSPLSSLPREAGPWSAAACRSLC